MCSHTVGTFFPKHTLKGEFVIFSVSPFLSFPFLVGVSGDDQVGSRGGRDKTGVDWFSDYLWSSQGGRLVEDTEDRCNDRDGLCLGRQRVEQLTSSED